MRFRALPWKVRNSLDSPVWLRYKLVSQASRIAVIVRSEVFAVAESDWGDERRLLLPQPCGWIDSHLYEYGREVFRLRPSQARHPCAQGDAHSAAISWRRQRAL